MKVFVNRDYTLNYEVPEPTSVLPIEVAILRNGIKGAIIISIFNLWKRKAINLTLGKRSVLMEKINSSASEFSDLEHTIYHNLSKPRYYRDFYRQKAIKTLEQVIEPNIKKLKEMKLLADKSIIGHYWTGVILGILLLLAFGGTKLYFGIVREKPFGFLVLLLIISHIVLFMIIQPNKVRITTLGKNFLVTAQKRFEWLKTQKSNKNLLKDENLQYGIACFGIAAFMGSELGKVLQNPFVLEQRTDSLFGGTGCAGCGGYGCSGGGCSDAGCSGGCSGGCGGGCGGCGGD